MLILVQTNIDMTLIPIALTLISYGLLFYILWWGAAKIGLPEPFGKVLTVILVVACVAVLWGLLTGSLAPFAIFSGLF
jgi:hypothetical protein